MPPISPVFTDSSGNSQNWPSSKLYKLEEIIDPANLRSGWRFPDQSTDGYINENQCYTVGNEMVLFGDILHDSLEPITDFSIIPAWNGPGTINPKHKPLFWTIQYATIYQNGNHIGTVTFAELGSMVTRVYGGTGASAAEWTSITLHGARYRMVG